MKGEGGKVGKCDGSEEKMIALREEVYVDFGVMFMGEKWWSRDRVNEWG